MKKSLLLLLICILLLACVPTPEEEFVVYRGDDAESFAAGREKADFSSVPAHLSLSVQPEKYVTVEYDADVQFDRNGAFPILEVRPVDAVTNPDLIIRLLSSLCPDGKVYERWKPCKDEVKEELIAAKSYDGSEGSMAEVDEDLIRSLEEAYRDAPDEPQRTAADVTKGLSPEKEYYIERADGSIALLRFHSASNRVTYCDEYHTGYYPEEMLEPGDPPLADAQISEQDATLKAEAFLKMLGTECTQLASITRGFAFAHAQYKRGETVWICTFVRRIGTTDSIVPNENAWQYPRDAASAIGAPWEGLESIEVVIGADGVKMLEWSGLCETSGVLEQDATLLAFDQAIERFSAQLGYQYAFAEAALTVKVDRIRLLYGVVSEKDKPSYGLYIPLWEISYRLDDDPEQRVFQRYFSALDGATAEPRTTTANLQTAS